MTTPKEIAQKYATAFLGGEKETARALLHDDYTFVGPMMQLNSADEAMGLLENFPFVASEENVTIVTEGNLVVKKFDWKVTAPFEALIPMTEWFDIQDGKIKSCQLFYDSALFPKEAMA